MKNGTEGEPRFAENANQPTRGIRLLKPRIGRPKPWGVQWREAGKAKTEFFANEEARDRRAKSILKAKRDGAAVGLTQEEVEAWRAFQRAVGGVSWLDVVAGWQRDQAKSGVVANTVTVEDHAKDYMARMVARVKRQETSDGSRLQAKHKLGLFVDCFGANRLGAVTTDEIRAWLESLNITVAATYNNHRKIVSSFFGDAVNLQIVHENPVARIKKRDEVGEEVGILTVPQLAHLFDVCRITERYRPILWRLALESFAGVRYSSACRLTAEDVRIEDKGIRHTARSIKTRKRQYVDGYPDNLWAWLKITEFEPLTERQYLALKSELFVAAQVPHPHNCLRHSFASYHLAARSNPGTTAYLLCHRNQTKLWDNYKGNVTSEEGRRWETLTPTTATELAAEWVSALKARQAKARAA